MLEILSLLARKTGNFNIISRYQMSIQDLSQQLKLLIMKILGRSLKYSKEAKKKGEKEKRGIENELRRLLQEDAGRYGAAPPE
jgi:hypothetical protein